jgi:hypothetical protein
VIMSGVIKLIKTIYKVHMILYAAGRTSWPNGWLCIRQVPDSLMSQEIGYPD